LGGPVKVLSRLTLLVFVVFSLLTSSCAIVLFPDFWDTDESEAFARAESPYSESPDAVVLFDVERIRIDTQEWDLIREHHKRIQIFTEEGKEYADIRIPFWHSHKITEIKAHTILPDGRRVELEKAGIFEEGVEKKWRAKVFALPGVEDNCIIEYQYKYRSNLTGVIPQKYFQSDLYTEHSKLKLTLPSGFTYHGVTRNAPANFVDPEGVEVSLPNNRYEKYFIWEIHDIKPLIKNEAYMYNRNEHLFSLQMQMVSYVDAYNNITFIKEWDDMVERLLEIYDTYMDRTGPLKKLAATIEESVGEANPSPRDIYTYVRDHIESESYEGLGVDDMNQVIKSMRGTRIEKNLILVALLKEAGYEADPVIISRKSNGKINRGSPSINEFDHVIARVKVGDEYEMVDSGPKYFSYEYMPSDNYSGIGLIIAKGDAKFIEFPAVPPLSQRDILTQCRLEESGTLSGSFKIKSAGYYASRLRADHADAKDEESFVYEDIVDHIEGIVIDSTVVEINSEDRSKPVLTTIYFNIPDFLTPTGDMIYLSSAMYNKFTSNRLTNEDRSHPVEFDYPYNSRETINMQIPLGYEVIESPQNTSVRGPGMGFQKLTEVDGQHIQILWNRQLSKLVHNPGNYAIIKNFYTEAIAVDQRLIILKRIDS